MGFQPRRQKRSGRNLTNSKIKSNRFQAIFLAEVGGVRLSLPVANYKCCVMCYFRSVVLF